MKLIKPAFLLLSVCAVIGCSQQNESSNRFSSVIENVQQAFAPDPSLAIFNVSLARYDGQWVLRGETNLPAAKAALLDSLHERGIQVSDSLALLPSFLLGQKVYALVNNSVASLRTMPNHSAELLNQAMLGTPLKVFKKANDWFLVQTPDGQIAWIDSPAIVLMDEQEMETWKANEKIIFTELFGVSYLNPHFTDRIESDLVMGCILEKVGEDPLFYEVAYPDGRLAYIRKNESAVLNQWLSKVENKPEALVRTAYSFFGFPFLWGGTSPKGVDCSGLTKTLFYIHGTIIPRDLRQQLNSGKAVDASGGFENLQPGDLLFFGVAEQPDTPSHVGMWIGHNSFIHVSGRVKITSMDPESPLYEDTYRKNFLKARRYFSDNLELASMLPVKRVYLASQEEGM